MSETSNLSLPFLAAGQAQKHVTLNEQAEILDAAVQLSVVSTAVVAPPAAPVAGARYLVPAAATGLWQGQTGRIASWNGFEWRFLVPREGWLLWDQANSRQIIFSGGSWDPLASSAPIQNVPMIGINATADTANRLSVAAPSSLFNHSGDHHRLTINKADIASTASTVFQNAFSGRAEFGLCGDDRFHLKTSADGAIWRDALVVTPEDGRIAFPFGAPGLDLAINGRFRINQRGFTGGALAAGAYGYDRWRASGGAASLTVSGETIQLASGTLAQTIEPEFWQETSFAAKPFTVSVRNLSGGDLIVTLGSTSATISQGTGRRSATLTTSAADTGALNFTLRSASAGAVAFSSIQIEPGLIASELSPRSMATELLFCQRYFWRITGPLSLFLYAVGTGNYFFNSLPTPTRMRLSPNVSRVLASYGNLFQNDIANATASALNDSALRLSIRSAAAGECYANFDRIDLNAEFYAVNS